MSNMDVTEKTLKEALRAQEECVRAIDAHRFEQFKFSHAEGFVRVVEEMKIYEGQSDDAFQLYRTSLLLHYSILTSLTETVMPKETAFLEWMQTPATMEILFNLDSSFREAVEEFCRVIEGSEDVIAKEAMRLSCGFYGVTSAKDFAAIPGSTFKVLAEIAERSSIDRDYKLTILSSKSWGLNTSYVFGDAFNQTFAATGDVEKAIQKEIEAMKSMLLKPVETQISIMKRFSFSSFNPAEYFQKYMEEFRPMVERAYKEGVHLANIVMLPTHVGDVGHHIGWQYYHICRDEANMELLRVQLEMLKLNMQKAFDAGKISSVFDVSSFATGISAMVIYRMLSDEGFTADMLTRLFTERFYHSIMAKQFDRMMVNELHVNDFLDFAYRGKGLAKKGWKIKGYEVDFTPYINSEILNSGELYAFPFCAITTKFAVLMKYVDMPCLLAPEPPSIVAMINAVAMAPEKPFAPVELCKGCATAAIQPNRCMHCKAENLGL